MEQMKYYPALPHGEFQELFDGIWFIQGMVKMPMVLPIKISRSMTVVRIPGSKELVVVNSMRLTEDGFAELDRLGKVSHVLRLGGFHGRDDGYFRERYGAKIHAIEGQTYHRSFDGKGEPYMDPDSKVNELSELPIPDAKLIVIKSSTPPEAILRIEREGGILVTSDSLQNTPGPDAYVNFLGKMMMKKMNFYHPHQLGPGWLQFGKPSAAEIHNLAELSFDHVLPGHGTAVIGGAKEKYMPALTGPIKGCHE